MEIINPNFDLVKDNIFNIRQKEYYVLKKNILEILKTISKVGYRIQEFNIEQVFTDKYDLMPTVKDKVVMKFQKIDPNAKKHKNIDIDIMIPRLVGKNNIVIYGRKKIPEFQLVNYPLNVVGNTIKLNTNIWGFSLQNDRKNHCMLHLVNMNKKINFALILVNYYTNDKIHNWMERLKKSNTNFSINLYNDLKELVEQDPKKLIEDLGLKIATSLDYVTRAKDFLFYLDIINDIDIISKKYIRKDIINELLETCIEYDQNNISYLQYENKRIRCIEYMILINIMKIIFNFCLSARRRKHFKTSTSDILQKCSVSNIIQFDFCINPIEEITELCTLSLRGPGGFSKDNVPKYYRDIHESMKGRICTVDTPDRENCGVILRLLPNVNINQDLTFKSSTRKIDIISPACSMIPFLEHDDPTRLQMASSQMRQAVLILHNEKPMIMSGCEYLYTDQTKFYNVAEYDGIVIYKDENKIIVKYNNNEIKIFQLGCRKLYTIGDDVVSNLKSGEHIKKGDLITYSTFCRDDKSICIGSNLLVAVMPYKGYNYEDGIVIRKGLVEKLKTKGVKDLSFSLSSDKILLNLNNDPNEYKPIPEIGDIIEIGDPYAIIMSIPSSNTNLVFDDPVKLITDQKIKITDVKVYFNKVDISDFGFWIKWIKDTIGRQKQNDINLLKKLSNHLNKEEIQNFSDKFLEFIDAKMVRNKYTYNNEIVTKIKDEKIRGIYFYIVGEYVRPAKIGDKLGNRHGNKGIISKIIDDNNMPKLEKDGTPIDIIINPLGIISRMNIGQLYELHLSRSFYDFKTRCISMIRLKENQDIIRKYIQDYIELVSQNCPWYYEQFKSQFPEKVNETFIQNLCLIQPPFQSVNYDMIKKIMEYTSTSFTEYIIDDGKKIPNPISVGYIYFFRMVHIAEDKISGRGIGNYVKKTLQPSAGKKNEGGQRLGEMEFACLVGMNGIHNINECMGLKSDSITEKIDWLIKSQNCLCKQESTNESDEPETVKLLKAYLTVLGIEM